MFFKEIILNMSLSNKNTIINEKMVLDMSIAIMNNVASRDLFTSDMK